MDDERPQTAARAIQRAFLWRPVLALVSFSAPPWGSRVRWDETLCSDDLFSCDVAFCCDRRTSADPLAYKLLNYRRQQSCVARSHPYSGLLFSRLKQRPRFVVPVFAPRTEQPPLPVCFLLQRFCSPPRRRIRRATPHSWHQLMRPTDSPLHSMQ